MDNSTFWKIIDSTRDAAGNDPEIHIDVLRDALGKLGEDEIIEFDRLFDELHVRAYAWNLWGAAYLVGGGCSDDGFMDFRGWLISKGKEVYEAALINPDSLADVLTDLDGDGQVEGFHYVAMQAWKEKTDKDFPPSKVNYLREPAGESWDEDDLPGLFPKLDEKFE